MKIRMAQVALALILSSQIAVPVYARGFGAHFGGGGGFGRGGFGGFGGGNRSFGGGDRSFGGGDRSFGGGDRSFGGSGGTRDWGGGSSSGRESFGGGFNHLDGGGQRPTTSNRPNFDNGNHPNYGNLNFGNSGARTNAFSGDHGFSGVTNIQNHSPTSITQNNLNAQGKSVRNSFNNDTFNRTNVNVNHYGNNYGRYGGYGGYGYHGYGYGYHGYGYHPYGWGYPGSWYVPGWSAATAWTCAGLATLGSFLGIAALASSGGGKSNQAASSTNVIYEGDNVYINGQPAGTAAQYYQQAQQLAQAGQSAVDPMPAAGTAAVNTAAATQWQPLGVFALAEPGQTQSNMMLQLAIDQNGVVRGNYFNQLTNESSEVYGSLDKNTQRISWTIGNNTGTVFDASIGDLVKDDSSVLVHYGPTNTSRMALIRLQQPQSPPGQASG